MVADNKNAKINFFPFGFWGINRYSVLDITINPITFLKHTISGYVYTKLI